MESGDTKGGVSTTQSSNVSVLLHLPWFIYMVPKKSPTIYNSLAWFYLLFVYCLFFK